eukprot:TRINITY_DN641_c2_g1_i1.p1 TRINITY_DN641_c2_g1~~TRINITY_DN641_c2_g1_i1.p1  ORF type:complete len:546 (+),score=77.03 TRINITY_DN641_c2_g1_i1:127-1764(+)
MKEINEAEVTTISRRLLKANPTDLHGTAYITLIQSFALIHPPQAPFRLWHTKLLYLLSQKAITCKKLARDGTPSAGAALPKLMQALVAMKPVSFPAEVYIEIEKELLRRSWALKQSTEKDLTVVLESMVKVPVWTEGHRSARRQLLVSLVKFAVRRIPDFKSPERVGGLFTRLGLGREYCESLMKIWVKWKQIPLVKMVELVYLALDNNLAATYDVLEMSKPRLDELKTETILKLTVVARKLRNQPAVAAILKRLETVPEEDMRRTDVLLRLRAANSIPNGTLKEKIISSINTVADMATTELALYLGQGVSGLPGWSEAVNRLKIHMATGVGSPLTAIEGVQVAWGLAVGDGDRVLEDIVGRRLADLAKEGEGSGKDLVKYVSAVRRLNGGGAASGLREIFTTFPNPPWFSHLSPAAYSTIATSLAHLTWKAQLHSFTTHPSFTPPSSSYDLSCLLTTLANHPSPPLPLYLNLPTPRSPITPRTALSLISSFSKAQVTGRTETITAAGGSLLGKKIEKREAAAAVERLKGMGYRSEAFVKYLEGA